MPQAQRVSPRLFRLVLQLVFAALAFASISAWAQVGGARCKLMSAAGSYDCDFPYTGAVERWVVPPGVTQVGMFVLGAAGGTKPCQPGAFGAFVAAEFKVTPGETLSILVGQTGQLSPTRPNNGAGGGGGTFVWRGAGPITLQNVMAVGGGGGGAGCKGTPRNGSTGPGARNGVGGDKGSGVAGTNGNGGGGGDTTSFGPTGAGGGGGAGILSDGGSKNNPRDMSDSRLSSGWGGKSIASGGQGGAPGIAIKKFDNGPGEKGGEVLSQGGWGGFGGGGGGGGWLDDVLQARCTDRTAGGGGGGGGYSGGGGGSAGGSVASSAGQSNCGNYGNGGGGGGSFVTTQTFDKPAILEGDRTAYAHGTLDGRVKMTFFSKTK